VPEPWVVVVLGVAWLVGAALVVWLVWRAARDDGVEQERAEDAEPPEPRQPRRPGGLKAPAPSPAWPPFSGWRLAVPIR
jgi:hypothetical protein